MTREEAIKILRANVMVACDTSYKVGYGTPLNKAVEQALEMAIKALEQEPVLYKIRAEIKALSPEPTAYDVVDGNPIKDAVWETLVDVLKIIDKCKEDMIGGEE